MISRFTREPLAGYIRRSRFRSRLVRRPLVWARQRGLTRDDALLASYPRSGTTWLRFLLSEALTGQPAEFETVGRTVRYVGDHQNAPALLPDTGRLIFSHEPFETTDHRIIYAVRDPRSVLISEFRWLLRRGVYRDEFQAFYSDFLVGRTNPWGSWASHVAYWLGSLSASAGRLLIVRFEDLRADTEGTLKNILAFLNVELPADQVTTVVRNNSVDRMRAKEERAPDAAFSKGVKRDIRFINAGSTLGWRELLSEQQVERLYLQFSEMMDRFGYGIRS
jgi:hypothetical protein